MISKLVFLVALFALAIGYRSRNPTRGEWMLYPFANRRRGVGGLYILSGPSAVIAQAANRVVPISRRYGASLLDIRNLALLIGAAFTLFAAVMHIAWWMFDINAIGSWRFFPGESPLHYRARRSTIFLICTAITFYGAADWARIEAQAKARRGTWGSVWAQLGFLAPLGIAVTFQNSGIQPFMAFVLLVRFSATLGWLGLITVGGYVSYTNFNLMGVDYTVIFALCCATGILAWLALRTTVEILAFVWSRDADGILVICGFLAAAFASTAAAIAIPPATVLLLQGLALALPAQFTAGGQDIVAKFMAIPSETAFLLTLMGGLALVPVTSFLIFGLGAALGNRMPLIGRFRANLKAVEGLDLSFEAVDALLHSRRVAYFLGYSLAALIGLAALGGMLYAVHHALNVLISS